MKVSIILPTRNNENTIKRCLESIEKQTYKNKEVIFIDNYSTDNTYKIAKHFSKKINIKLFKK
jgi:glycosyltransferase involved in cell wall biosynthesis